MDQSYRSSATEPAFDVASRIRSLTVGCARPYDSADRTECRSDAVAKHEAFVGFAGSCVGGGGAVEEEADDGGVAHRGEAPLGRIA
jgi:hypothetical protein